MDKKEFIESIKGQLIVSCQALANEPLYGSQMMSIMALAAKEVGAVVIRANGVNDIKAVRKETQLPIIGLIKKHFENSEVYITPTEKEIQALIATNVDVTALDATQQKRPNGKSFEEMIQFIREKSHCLIMADLSTYEEGLAAEYSGVDLVLTTLSRYTPYTQKRMIPDFPLIEKLANALTIPVIAEGNIGTPEQAKKSPQFHRVRSLQINGNELNYQCFDW